MYCIKIFWFKSLFSSINIGISYLLNIALAKLEYVDIFLVIIDISLYLYPSSLTNFNMFFATSSISENWFLAKNNCIFSIFFWYFTALLLYKFCSKCINSLFLNLYLFSNFTYSTFVLNFFATSNNFFTVLSLE